MKKLLVAAFMLTASLTQAQEVKPTYSVEGDLVKVTYFYKDGSTKQQGYFKNKKLAGTWTTFDTEGNKTAIANYKNGKKVGKWYITSNDGLKEVIYKNNKVAKVNSTNVALK